jgi:hypothetical protein
MRQFMMTMAVATFGLWRPQHKLRASMEGRRRTANQCFKYSPGNDKDGRFGTWGACPQMAGARTASRSLPARTAAPPRPLPPAGPDRQREARDGVR